MNERHNTLFEGPRLGLPGWEDEHKSIFCSAE
jgi:hypothetical protein